MSTAPIRVLIVDEHDMVRKGLAVCLKLNDDLELIGEARDGREAVQLCEQLQPDIVLMDLLMPVMDGVAATRIIRRHWPQVQVIALTASQEAEMVRGVLQAGAIGYLLKNVSIDQVADAIRSAHAGRSTWAPEATQALNRSDSEPPASPSGA
jgi:NarL family two-component system response regulator LiaR